MSDDLVRLLIKAIAEKNDTVGKYEKLMDMADNQSIKVLVEAMANKEKEHQAKLEKTLQELVSQKPAAAKAPVRPPSRRRSRHRHPRRR